MYSLGLVLQRKSLQHSALLLCCALALGLLAVAANAETPAAPAAPWYQAARVFFLLGVYHIATGWDHLAFLFGLLLFGQSFGRLVKIVTAFTVAHSATLALAALGLVTPPSTLIEPAIALTVAYVGLANLMQWKNVHHIGLAFGFGLVHGFGFAGALAESLNPAQSDQGQWLISLASFNLGIEAFQILLVILLAPMLQWLRRFAWAEPARRVAAVLVLGAGLGWFLIRAVNV